MAYTFKYGDRPLDDFTIQRAVGSGGFGEVYYAVSDGGREVGLKYLRANPETELRGVSHCINLKSPHLVSIFDVKKNADGEYFIVMEYCSGPSLRDLLVAEPNGFGPQKAAFFVREIAKGLSYLHDRGIVHRDLKPGNIFYDDGYVKIGDYGLSKFIAVSRHSAQTASVGTVHYMAPEIGSGDYSRGVDIYALGVMLYEMLLGKVPFEGSSMAEVLMKHLTAQPELDQLPPSFGKVIRKALRKDPKDRYQNVNEMIEELLEADEVRESVAGFSTKSLEGAVRRGSPDRVASPIPSPNPAPPRPAARRAGGDPPWALPVGEGPLPKRVARRVERISHKLDRKIAKLGGVPIGASHGPRVHDGFMRRSERTGNRPAGRGKRIFLTLLLGVGLALALGIITGNALGEEQGFAGGLSVIFMSFAILLGRKVSAWFGVQDGPAYAAKFIQMICGAPLLALAATPLLASSGHGTWELGMGLWIGLLAVIVFGDWSKALDHREEEDVSIWSAVWTAFGALITTAVATGILDGESDDIMAVGAGAAGVVSIVMQSTAWWVPKGRGTAFGDPAAPPAVSHVSADRTDEVTDDIEAPSATPYAQPVGRMEDDRSYDWDPEARLRRWGFTRGFWGVIAFLAMGGAIVLFILALVFKFEARDDQTGVIIGCVACFVAMLFALRKTTPSKKETFWREHLRPFLMTLGLFGVGAATTGISRHWQEMRSNEDQAGLIVALVFSSLLVLVCTFARGRRRPRQPRPFLHDRNHADDDAKVYVGAIDLGSGAADDSPHAGKVDRET